MAYIRVIINKEKKVLLWNAKKKLTLKAVHVRIPAQK